MAQFIIDVDVRGEQALKKLGIQVDKVDKKGDRLGKTFKKVAVAMAAVFAGGALINSFKQIASEIDKTAKSAQRLGLTVQALNEMNFAAEQTGVSVETMNMAIQRMNRRISEATLGTGEARDALAELGLSAEELNKQSPQDTFNDVADAMQNVASHGRKTALAMKLFDSEGVSLIQTMANGSDGIKEYAAQMERLGIITEKQSSDVEDMNDSFNSLSTVFGYLGQVFVATLAPVLKDISDTFTSLAADTKLYSDVVEGLAFILGKVVQLFGFLAVGVSTAASGYNLLKEAILGTAESFKEATKDAELHVTALGDVFLKMVGLNDENEKFSEGQVEVSKAQAKSITLWEEMRKAMSAYAKKAKTDAQIAAEAINYIGATLENGITSSFRAMMDGAVDWKAAMGNILKDIITQLFKLLVVQKAVNAAMGYFGGTSAPVKSGSITGARANGGSVLGGSTYLVGERGPELFTPSGSGAITSNSNMGGGETNIVVNNYSKSEVTTQTDDQGNIEIIINEIANQITRGVGSIGTSLERRYALQKV